MAVRKSSAARRNRSTDRVPEPGTPDALATELYDHALSIGGGKEPLLIYLDGATTNTLYMLWVERQRRSGAEFQKRTHPPYHKSWCDGRITGPTLEPGGKRWYLAVSPDGQGTVYITAPADRRPAGI